MISFQSLRAARVRCLHTTPTAHQAFASTAGAYSHGRSTLPKAENEPQFTYARGTDGRIKLDAAIKDFRSGCVDIPMIINGEEVRTGNTANVCPPYDHQAVVGKYHLGGRDETRRAIEAALAARPSWATLPFEERAAVLLKMAALISGPYRAEIAASTVVGQSKNFFQAEIDSTCELIDFLRFNVEYAQQIYENQPTSPMAHGVFNRTTWRPLEGFIYAATPFNFTAIAGNLVTAPALMGNVVVWKPSDKAMLSAHVLNELFHESGFPAGVINMVQGDPVEITDECLSHPDLAGIHYTGSTQVFEKMWSTVGKNISSYKAFPRIVGETGGKDFIIAHSSAKPVELAVSLTRGAFEFAGQKCSACSRAYVPESLWPRVLEEMKKHHSEMKMGSPEDQETFVTPVIAKDAFERCRSYIEHAKGASDAEVILGGTCDDSKGWFVQPTVIHTTNPHFKSMEEEIFGPVLTVYVYPDAEFEDTLKLVDSTSPYALTGSIFAQDRKAVETATTMLENSSGNFYVNDKCTGAVVGQQPFGGMRKSGTNDKAGSYLNLLRWVSCRAIKETLVPPKDLFYPYMSS